MRGARLPPARMRARRFKPGVADRLAGGRWPTVAYVACTVGWHRAHLEKIYATAGSGGNFDYLIAKQFIGRLTC